jgi:hypothetical protein
VTIGIRANTEDLSGALRSSFHSYLAWDTEAYPTFSIRIEPLPADPMSPRSLHVLYEGCTALVRARSARHVLETLRLALGDILLEQTPDRHLQVKAQLISLGGAAVLLPPHTQPPRGRLVDELDAQGFRRLALRTTRIDVASAQLVVPSLLPWTESPLRSFLGSAWADSVGPLVRPGYYGVAGWILDGEDHGISKAEALAHVLRRLVAFDMMDVSRTMSCLANVLKSAARVEGAHDSVPVDVFGAAREMLRVA